MSAEEYMSMYDGIPESDLEDGPMTKKVFVDREEITRLRDIDDRLTNILGMREQVVETLREELQHMYDNSEFSYSKAQRKAEIKGRLGQLEYDVKLLKGILTGD